ncbi:gallate 1-beta-glucosyltransferase 84A24 [Lathyrus oleraceus]|uniref:gallate 1-beta-glucosyltransferase 84A24 n=1 Tax=Pisum sativum TaxID=3888 RepID=UPI0021D0AE87|nr:gallate 1-beta-glucosyltransferase 84A24-like [Pisum sativum]
MESKAPTRILLVSYPAQGHINPLLRLAKCLAAKGSSVIFTTTKKAGSEMQTVSNITDKTVTKIGDDSLSFDFFDDGLNDDDPMRENLSDYTSQLEHVGKQYVSQLIKNQAESETPISCIINNIFISWVCDVATENEIPFAILWSESSAVLTIYYNYFHKLVAFPSKTEPYIDVHLPSVILKHNEIPDLLHPFNGYHFRTVLVTLILGQIKNLSKALCVLVDTYEELEHDFIDYISKKSVIIRPIGPLFKNLKTKGDFVKSDDSSDIIEWLNSKPEDSVVYISFGTIVHLPQGQVNEIAYGLLDSQVSFLWALRQQDDLPNGFLEETNGRGKVVKWCPQVQVLSNPSVACFITHCGWNSSMEALASGVPVLTFPDVGDQITNAKFLVDFFRVGIRLGYTRAEKKLVTRDDVKKCLLEAMEGPKAEELKQNAMKWKKAANGAVVAGAGSSDRSLDAFLEDIKSCGAVNIQNI